MAEREREWGDAKGERRKRGGMGEERGARERERKGGGAKEWQGRVTGRRGYR